MIVHYDLFAGIGGFSLAIDNIFGKENAKHIFVERDEFCQAVLKKHWPAAEYHSDIIEFIAHAKCQKFQRSRKNTKRFSGQPDRIGENKNKIILTGGFPCQPFSQAGQRKGTEDNRFLWPSMFESIRLIRPDWIVAENVSGFVTMQQGLVLEQVCTDLENEGYEVQPFIIPACAVNAPHRRDRVWIIANSTNSRSEILRQERKNSIFQNSLDVTYPKHDGFDGTKNRKSDNSRNVGNEKRKKKFFKSKGANCIRSKTPNWGKNWHEVATEFCRMDDGIPRRMDRNPRLKALGNAIVPQVAEQIFKKIKCLL